ncbi:GNAT family N-acetyltransferase [Jannaschia seohaensis]|uniref:Ribosomal protein S18 acetylase RimI n=1 Tax=Jannaschia seohaensis TaxID=475081 RepID=A0A2Y9B2Z7_9RHOB|nr:GNAT family N-acetyltransferase [Jannaschia seohaensis]PWJ15009.1 ribosomal protein S18 acetylase RimI-like enzyme [Jannaschia seohaensis]SSA49858.1 Ribosomal protein S18 acetylase RimI [Jannaschia seohaensis]
MIVRPLGAEDAAAWHALMAEGTRTHPAAFLLSPREVGEMTQAQAVESVSRGHLHGLFDDGLIGFSGLHLWQLDRLRHRADIGPFFVTEGRRGTEAANTLMEALAARAKEAGVIWLDLWVAASNGRARAFYRRHDFAEIARREDAVRLGERSEDDVLMTRRLSR